MILGDAGAIEIASAVLGRAVDGEMTEMTGMTFEGSVTCTTTTNHHDNRLSATNSLMVIQATAIWLNPNHSPNPDLSGHSGRGYRHLEPDRG